MTEKERAAPREGGPLQKTTTNGLSDSTSKIAMSTSRLVIAQFRFLPDASGLKVCLPGKATALARLVPDEIHAGMWRVVRPIGDLTDMVNKTRAKDIAFGLAETAVYLRLPSQSEPAKNGHFFEGSAPPVRQTGRAVVITFTPGPGVDAIRSLRLLLKAAKRRFGLVATDAYEDRSAPLQISNQVADEFQELRDGVVAERAQAWRRP